MPPLVLRLPALFALLAACATPRHATVSPPAAPRTALLPQAGTVEHAAIVRSAEALLLALPSDSATACVTIVSSPPVRHAPAPSPFLEAIRRTTRRLVPGDTCPPSFAPPMISIVDSLGRLVPRPAAPPGYVDPYALYLRLPERRGDTLVVDARVRQGTSGRGYDCVVAPPLHATARCTATYVFMH